MAGKKSEGGLRKGLPATHPGALLRETVLPALKEAGVAKVAVAESLGISRQALENLINEKAAVTPEMALRLSRYLGSSPIMWLNLQRDWDLEKATEKLGDELSAITPAPREARA